MAELRKPKQKADGKPDVPWRKIAEYIVEKGASYGFSHIACSRRWDVLHGGHRSRHHGKSVKRATEKDYADTEEPGHRQKNVMPQFGRSESKSTEGGGGSDAWSFLDDY